MLMPTTSNNANKLNRLKRLPVQPIVAMAISTAANGTEIIAIAARTPKRQQRASRMTPYTAASNSVATSR